MKQHINGVARRDHKQQCGLGGDGVATWPAVEQHNEDAAAVDTQTVNDVQATLADGSLTVSFTSQGQRQFVLSIPAEQASRLAEIIAESLRLGSPML